MDNKVDGFTADPEALDYYIGHIVNPALENFERVAGNLSAAAGLSYATMLGGENLPGSTEFTGTCRRALDTFFEVHHALTERQHALVRTATRFRDNLAESSATYLRNEAGSAQSIGILSGQLETRLQSDGATG